MPGAGVNFSLVAEMASFSSRCFWAVNSVLDGSSFSSLFTSFSADCVEEIVELTCLSALSRPVVEIIETEQELRRLQEEAATTSTALAKIEEAGGKLAAAGDTIAGAGKKMSVLSAAVVGVGAAAVQTTAEFDAAMSKVAPAQFR